MPFVEIKCHSESEIYWFPMTSCSSYHAILSWRLLVIRCYNTLWAIIAIFTGHKFHLIQWTGTMSVASQWKISSLRWFTHFLSTQLSNQISAGLSQPQRISHLFIQNRAAHNRSRKVISSQYGLFHLPSPLPDTISHGETRSYGYTVKKVEENAAAIRLWITETSGVQPSRHCHCRLRVCFSSNTDVSVFSSSLKTTAYSNWETSDRLGDNTPKQKSVKSH